MIVCKIHCRGVDIPGKATILFIITSGLASLQAKFYLGICDASTPSVPGICETKRLNRDGRDP